MTTNTKPSALIGCECSGVVRDAMRAAGIDAWSCDLKPCERGSEHHIQGDVLDAMMSRPWQFIGLHPDCTAMAVSGNRWYGSGAPKCRERDEAVVRTVYMWTLAKQVAKFVYLENPVSVIFRHLKNMGENVHYIQPWQHGHGETKKTGLALHGLPPLMPSNVVDGREQRIWKMPPGPNRKADRSRTLSGVGAAIADQWGGILIQQAKKP